MLNTFDILETIKMIDEEHLDIRTVTMGISLRDCASDSVNKVADKIYDKICRRAEKLVATCDDIAGEYGIPIINKRVSVTPVSFLCDSVESDDVIPLAHAMQRAAETVGINFIGGFSALVHKGFTLGDRRLIGAIPQALAETECVCSSVKVATTRQA